MRSEPPRQVNQDASVTAQLKSRRLSHGAQETFRQDFEKQMPEGFRQSS